MQAHAKKYTFILLKSVLLSVLLYGVGVYHSKDKLIKNEEAQFHLLTKSIQDYKSTLYLIGVLFEAQVEASKGKTIKEEAFERGQIYYYHYDRTLTHNEKVVSATAEKMFNSMPAITNDKSHALYYRSYEGKKLLSSKNFAMSPQEVKEAFSEKSCLATLNCAYYMPAEDLANRLIASDIYQDTVTNQQTITLSTPVYDGEVMVGDVNVDIYLGYFPFLSNKSFISSNSVEKRQVIIENLSYPFYESAFLVNFDIDNNFEFVYRIPYSKLIIDTSWWLACLIIVVFYVLLKLEELKVKREKLELAEIAISKDELTGLYNRAILRDSALKYAIEKQGLSVIVVDGDGLKPINDTHGHHAGDQAIVHIANRMIESFRESDYLVRSGGDEFLVLLPGCTGKTAEILAEKFANDIESHSFGDKALTISISFGVTEVMRGESLDAAIKRADNLLYRDKRRKARLLLKSESKNA
ncbi:putative two-component response regulator and GGDEF family protein YeaJ [Vibrio maritimus]|uniref:diguanylate cyclase n=1 Tax=Vibrio maritimus TaxID=990268 RepID=A0A090RP29_9VIBR|nr:putative two-component response regulator and GGDEF family protein YeaJ [Vibrio maritimus]